MDKGNRVSILYALTIFLLFGFTILPKETLGQRVSNGKAVLWERVNISKQNLLLGPGGQAMRPNLRRITFVEEKKGGYSTKYEIKDGAGQVWVAKIGKEAQ